MKKLMPLVLVLALAPAGILLAQGALAQQVKLPAGTERMTLTNLRYYMLADDGKSVSPLDTVAEPDYHPFVGP